MYKKYFFIFLFLFFLIGVNSVVYAASVSVTPNAFIIGKVQLPLSVELSWDAYSIFGDLDDLKCTAESVPTGIWSGEIPLGKGTKTFSISDTTTFKLTCCGMGYRTKIVNGEEIEVYQKECDSGIAAVSAINPRSLPAWISVSPSQITKGDTAILEFVIKRTELNWNYGGSNFKLISNPSAKVINFSVNNCKDLTSFSIGRKICTPRSVHVVDDLNDAYLFGLALADDTFCCNLCGNCYSATEDQWTVKIQPDTTTVFSIIGNPTGPHSTKGCFSYKSGDCSVVDNKTVCEGRLVDCNSGQILSSKETATISQENCQDVTLSSANAGWGYTLTSNAWDTINNLGDQFIGLGGTVVMDGGGSNYSISDTITIVSSSLSCSVTATADPNPIPEGQNQTTISASGSNYTSCTGTGDFTQTDSSHTYTVYCTGDAGYNDCISEITVTKGGIPSTSEILLSADKYTVLVNENVKFTANGSGNLDSAKGLTWYIADINNTKCIHSDNWNKDCGKFKGCQKMSLNNISDIHVSFLNLLRCSPLFNDFAKIF